MFFFFSSRRRHTSCALVTGIQTCALPVRHSMSPHGCTKSGWAMTDAAPACPLPPRRPLVGWWDFMVRGWRPAASWTCVAILLTRGAVIPIVQLCRREPVDAFDFVAFAALAGALKLAHARKEELLGWITS